MTNRYYTNNAIISFNKETENYEIETNLIAHTKVLSDEVITKKFLISKVQFESDYENSYNLKRENWNDYISRKAFEKFKTAYDYHSDYTQDYLWDIFNIDSYIKTQYKLIIPEKLERPVIGCSKY